MGALAGLFAFGFVLGVLAKWWHGRRLVGRCGKICQYSLYYGNYESVPTVTTHRCIMRDGHQGPHGFRVPQRWSTFWAGD